MEVTSYLRGIGSAFRVAICAKHGRQYFPNQGARGRLSQPEARSYPVPP